MTQGGSGVVLNPYLWGALRIAFRNNSFECSICMNANESVSPRFQHVTITFPIGQEAGVRSFYVGALGFREKPIPKVVKPLGWVWFDTGVPGVELHCVPDEELVPADTRHHFCLQVDDLERQRNALVDSASRSSRRVHCRYGRVFLRAILSIIDRVCANRRGLYRRRRSSGVRFVSNAGCGLELSVAA